MKYAKIDIPEREHTGLKMTVAEAHKRLLIQVGVRIETNGDSDDTIDTDGEGYYVAEATVTRVTGSIFECEGIWSDTRNPTGLWQVSLNNTHAWVRFL